MSIRRTLAVLSFVAISAGPALAGTTPGTTAPASAVQTVTGAVKTFVPDKHALTVTVNQKDTVFNLGTVVVDPAVTKVGTMVDVTLNGPTVTAVVVHQAH